jgi:hypothetical protein
LWVKSVGMVRFRLCGVREGWVCQKRKEMRALFDRFDLVVLLPVCVMTSMGTFLETRVRGVNGSSFVVEMLSQIVGSCNCSQFCR